MSSASFGPNIYKSEQKTVTFVIYNYQLKEL